MLESQVVECSMGSFFFRNKIGLYRDDGLATCNKTARETENIKKEICKIFKENKLNITIEANKNVIDFLDITMDLRTRVHKPFMKPNNKNTPICTHQKQPPTKHHQKHPRKHQQKTIEHII